MSFVIKQVLKSIKLITRTMLLCCGKVSLSVSHDPVLIAAKRLSLTFTTDRTFIQCESKIPPAVF